MRFSDLNMFAHFVGLVVGGGVCDFTDLPGTDTVDDTGFPGTFQIGGVNLYRKSKKAH